MTHVLREIERPGSSKILFRYAKLKFSFRIAQKGSG